MPSPFNVSNERYPLPCFEGEADSEGFFKAAPGVNSFPMSLRLPIGKGAKGGFKSKLGEVRYIVIGSIKLKAQDGSSRSIAHFYRHIEVFPYLDPALTLKSLDEPIKASASKSLFLGGDGKVKLTASIHRANWLAGQQCYINVEVINDSSKRVKSMTLSLNRTISTFKPLSPERFKGEPAPEIQPEQVSKKKMAETTLECGKKASHGGVTAKGSWLGVEKHRKADFMHSLLIPVCQAPHLPRALLTRIIASSRTP